MSTFSLNDFDFIVIILLLLLYFVINSPPLLINIMVHIYKRSSET